MKKLITGVIFSIVLTVGVGAVATQKDNSEVENVALVVEQQQEIKENFEIKNILTQSTENFYLEPGTVAIEFKNGSYAYANTDIEGNTVYCLDNGKEIIEFGSRKEINNYLGLDLSL